MTPHDPWPLLAALARQDRTFLACTLRDHTEADLAIAFGIPRQDVYRLLVCLTPRTEADLHLLTAHFHLAPGSLAAVLQGDPALTSRTPARTPVTMQAGGPA